MRPSRCFLAVFQDCAAFQIRAFVSYQTWYAIRWESSIIWCASPQTFADEVLDSLTSCRPKKVHQYLSHDCISLRYQSKRCSREVRVDHIIITADLFEYNVIAVYFRRHLVLHRSLIHHYHNLRRFFLRLGYFIILRSYEDTVEEYPTRYGAGFARVVHFYYPVHNPILGYDIKGHDILDVACRLLESLIVVQSVVKQPHTRA